MEKKSGHKLLWRLLDVGLILILIMFSSLLILKAMSIGFETGTADTAWTLFYIYCGFFGVIAIGCLIAEARLAGDYQELMAEKKKRLHRAAQRLDTFTSQTEKKYLKLDKPDDGWNYAQTRYKYLGEYYLHRGNFEQNTKNVIQEWKTEASSYLDWGRLWKLFIVVGIVCQFMACNYVVGVDMKNDEKRLLNSLPLSTEWTAKTIPMPHLSDGMRYVSNPDSIVTPHTEQQLNTLLKQMDDSLGIESAVIIVKHVANRDIFGFSQELFDLYHIGTNDRGLVMVLAYDDHLFRSHTGLALEADLTDAECSQLQQQYLIPSMKAEQPDSGMLYLTQAVYNTLKGKELPTMSTLHPKPHPQEESEHISILTGFYMLIFGFWLILFSYIGRRYGWFLSIYVRNIMPINMFVNVRSILPFFFGGNFYSFGGSHFSSGGGYSSHSSSSSRSYSSSSSSHSYRSSSSHSHSSGGYGGGRSGGGGATSSW